MRYSLLCPALLAAGCCTYDPATPIYVETTLARLELPERPTRVVRLSSGGSSSDYYVLSPDHVATPPSVENSMASDDTPDRDTCDDDTGHGMFGRIDVCLGKRLSVGYSRRHAGPPLGHVMLYLAGAERERALPGNVSLALSAAWGHDSLEEYTRRSNGDEYRTRVRWHETDFGVILGYRVEKWLMFYGGPYRLDTDFDVRHQRPSTPEQASSGDIVATGAHLGLGLFAGRHSSWLIEYSRASVHAGQGSESIGSWSAQYQLEFFGKGPPPRRRAEPQAPKSSRYGID